MLLEKTKYTINENLSNKYYYIYQQMVDVCVYIRYDTLQTRTSEHSKVLYI